jgi:hypothetical protein
MQIDHLVIHKMVAFKEDPAWWWVPSMPLVEGQYLWKPCFGVEGGKDGLGQQDVGGPFVVPKIYAPHPF